ncbi:hypothetical protein HAX54_051515, partial [Datura stramonium]|nr:hypothetical protein [Datura stramonium]
LLPKFGDNDVKIKASGALAEKSKAEKFDNFSTTQPSALLAPPEGSTASADCKVLVYKIIMASQNDENLAASSSNAMSLEAESPGPSQLNEYIELGKRKRHSK